jgi:ADP-ribose pyrophosphatase YjhB (NUDIX family)
MKKDKRPLVGIGIIVIHKKRVLVLRRINSHGNKTWAFIGGHLEFNE